MNKYKPCPFTILEIIIIIIIITSCEVLGVVPVLYRSR
jgi:hypothetical protein